MFRVFRCDWDIVLKFLSFGGSIGFVDFAFWPRQEIGFDASDCNKDASYASTAHELTLDASRTIRMTVVLAHPFPNRSFWKHNGERGGREREKRKGRKKEKGEKEKRRQQTATHHGPRVARAKRALLLALVKRYSRNWIVFIFFARFSYVGGAFSTFALARKCNKMHTKKYFKARRCMNLHILNQIWPLNHGIGLWYRWVAPWVSGLGARLFGFAR